MDDYKDVAAVQKDNQTLNAFMWELGTLFENAPETMTGFLTAIYDGDANYVKKTRVGAKEHIPYPLLNLIGGTTPRWLGDNLSKNAVEGGLVARTIPVHSDELSFDAPEPEISPGFLQREERLSHDLAHILRLNGQFEWAGGRKRHDGPCKTGCGCGEAFAWYDSWYRDRTRIPRVQDNRTQSYYVRKPIHLLKVAMLLSLARDDSLTFTVDSLLQAKAMLEKIEGGMKHAFSAVGSNPFATDLERIHNQIKQSGGLSKAEVIAANYHNIDQQKMEMTLKSLEELQYVKKIIKDGAGIFYIPTSSGGE